MSTSTHDELWSARQRLVEDLLAELRERRDPKDREREPKLIETHISWVLLGREVYKIKKPVRLPFLDFASLESRERACRTELRINRRLAHGTYLDVVPIRRRTDGRFTFGKGSGAVVEWAVQFSSSGQERVACELEQRRNDLCNAKRR